MSGFAMNNPARSDLVLSRTNWREAAVLLTLSGLVPMLVHLIPWTGHRPIGVYLLPVFWTTFVAIYLQGATSGLLVGLVTTGVNLLVTGLPASKDVGLMSLEVVFYSVVAARLVTRRPNFRLTAPLAYVVAKAATVTIQFVVPAFGDTENPLRHLVRSTQSGLAGLAVLAVVNLLLVAYYPKDGDWERE